MPMPHLGQVPVPKLFIIPRVNGRASCTAWPSQHRLERTGEKKKQSQAGSIVVSQHPAAGFNRSHKNVFTKVF